MDSKILLTFGDMIRVLPYLFILSIFATSCSKEENIPFKDAEKDTLAVKDYKKIQGTYVGTIQNIEFINDNSYVGTGPPKPFTVIVTEVNFDQVSFDKITNMAAGGAEAEMHRFTEEKGYLRMLPHTMPDEISFDSVYYNPFKGRLEWNGLYFYDKGTLDYFIRRDTIRQVFKGVKK